MKKRELLKRLQDNQIPYMVLRISEDAQIVIVQRGGRVFGPFCGEDGEGLFWASEKLNDARQALELLNSSDWNIGGDRLWFGPEIRYSVSDRTHFWDTLHTPEAIDPGNYILNINDSQAILEQRIEMERADGDKGAVKLNVSRSITASENPLRELKDYDRLMENVRFCGYRQRICLNSEGEAVEGWNLLQVHGGGNIYIPMYQVETGTNYYEPAGEYERCLDNGILLKATGCNRYKVGYRAALVTGRLGYVCEWDKAPCLLIRSFPNDPSGIYEEEPPHMPGIHGFSVHVYNDDGNSGGFSEIECTLPAISGNSGRDSSDDIISTWIFTGDSKALRHIGRVMLGTDDIIF